MYHGFLIHSSVDGHLGSFHVLAIINSAAMNIGREVGVGIRMGNTFNLWLIHVNVWQNPLQYCKAISLQLVKINETNKQTKYTTI